MQTWKEAREGWDTKRGKSWDGGDMEKEEKQGTYFPVYPNLRWQKRLKIRG